MATIKSYSDLQQSRKLAEILPLESADMCYPKDAFEYHYDKEPVCHYSGIGLAHPCWSLAALLDILPNENMLVKTTGCEYYCLTKDVMTEHYDNPIDACYEMIIKLHELKMLCSWK